MKSLSGRIFRSIFLTTLAVVVLVGATASMLIYAMLDRQLQRELQNMSEIIVQALPTTTNEAVYLEGLAVRDTRITWIAANGTVYYDSIVMGPQDQDAPAPALSLENHLDRSEVRDALATGIGTARRHSQTLDEETLYYARRLPDGTILRVAGTQRSILGIMATMLGPSLVILVGAALAVAVIARFTTRRMLRPLEVLDFDQPLTNDTYPELAPLLTRLDAQHRAIEQGIAQLDARRHEFQVVTSGMREGLVLIDAAGMILYLNTAAMQLFDAQAQDCVGAHVLTLNRSKQLQEALKATQEGTYADKTLELGGRVYRLMANPVFSPSKPSAVAPRGSNTASEGEGTAVFFSPKPSGAALLVMDITERHDADMLRREFSANVSHELKTPLTVINGYAELMRQGMVKGEDVARFAGLIHDEAGRLITLIEDVITLSQLDEVDARPFTSNVFEPVDLLELSQEVCAHLVSFAAERHVTLVSPTALAHTNTTVLGIRVLLYHMLYNLVENGIRYTDAEGTVAVAVEREDGSRVVRVTDTGIGIPAAYHEKVFERFFCVDQSRSKTTGGTGLGLAIVKHGANLHGAKIALQSVESQGTTITVRFP